MRLFFIFLLMVTQISCGDFLNIFTNNIAQIEQGNLAIRPTNVSPETEFDVLLNAQGPIEIVKAQIEGATMYMGFIPLFFEQVDKNHYLAKAMVGVCNTDKMVWQVNVSYKQVGSDNIYATSLNFTVTNP